METEILHLKDLESNYMEATAAVNNLIEEMEKTMVSLTEEKRMMLLACGMSDREKELFSNYSRLFDTGFSYSRSFTSMSNEKATLEQEDKSKVFQKLAGDQKREMEELLGKFIELKKMVDVEHSLKLEIDRLREAFQAVSYSGKEDGNLETNQKLVETEELLSEKEEVEQLQTLNQTLILSDLKSRNELQKARKNLISHFKDANIQGSIGVKRMGELNSLPFHTAAKRGRLTRDASEKAAELVSLWECHLKDPHWHPFRIIQDKEGNVKDERICELKKLGDEAYNAVITAWKELNEYNPSARYPVQELWNFKEGRRATLDEAMQYSLNPPKQAKRKRVM